MEDPPTEIQDVLSQILDISGPDGSNEQETRLIRQKEAIRRYTARDVEFVHPGAVVKGREKFEQVYEFWGRQNWSNKATASVTAWNPTTGLLVVDVHQNFHHKYRHWIFALIPLLSFSVAFAALVTFWPVALPLAGYFWYYGRLWPLLTGSAAWMWLNRPTSARTIAFVWCERGGDGKWRIKKQEDFYPAEKLADAVSNTGWLYRNLVQIPGGLLWTDVILQLEILADAAWEGYQVNMKDMMSGNVGRMGFGRRGFLG